MSENEFLPDVKNIEHSPKVLGSIKEILSNEATPDWFKTLAQQNGYKNSVLLGTLAQQSLLTGWDNLAGLFTDLDGTYVVWKNFSQQEQTTLSLEEKRALSVDFAQPYIKSAERLLERLNKKSRPIFAVSGRDMNLIRIGQPGGKEFERAHFPMFPACAGAVGTEISILQKDGTYIPDDEWTDYIRNNIGFNRAHIYGQAATIDEPATGCVGLLQKLSEYKLQFQTRDTPQNVLAWQNDPENKQGNKIEEKPQDFKISFWFEGNNQSITTVKQAFEEMLSSVAINRPQVKTVISHHKTLNNGEHVFNLDLVPVSKRDAIEYMANKYHLFAVVSGDSGNDEDMLLNALPKKQAAGVIVGGAKAELVESVHSTLESSEIRKQTKHFTSFNHEGDSRLLYIGLPEEGHGPTSLDAAIHAFELLDAVRKNN